MTRHTDDATDRIRLRRQGRTGNTARRDDAVVRAGSLTRRAAGSRSVSVHRDQQKGDDDRAQSLHALLIRNDRRAGYKGG